MPNEEVIYLVQSAHYAEEGREAHLSADTCSDRGSTINWSVEI